MANNTTITPTTTSPAMSNVTKFDPYDYQCNEGLMLPVISEYTWSTGARCFLYLLGLFWCFLAVAIVADIFMCAIERITSKTRIVRMPDSNAPEGYRELEIKVSRARSPFFDGPDPAIRHCPTTVRLDSCRVLCLTGIWTGAFVTGQKTVVRQ